MNKNIIAATFILFVAISLTGCTSKQKKDMNENENPPTEVQVVGSADASAVPSIAPPGEVSVTVKSAHPNPPPR